jgi:hypothetical protein
MRYRASFFTGLMAGYILGARAGRERYEQIQRAASSVWNNPQVRRAADTAKTQTTHLVGSAARVAADTGKAVTEKVGDKLPPRISDKLPGHHGDKWDAYAHSGHNGHLGTGGTPSTGGTTSTGGPV